MASRATWGEAAGDPGGARRAADGLPRMRTVALPACQPEEQPPPVRLQGRQLGAFFLPPAQAPCCGAGEVLCGLCPQAGLPLPTWGVCLTRSSSSTHFCPVVCQGRPRWGVPGAGGAGHLLWGISWPTHSSPGRVQRPGPALIRLHSGEALRLQAAGSGPPWVAEIMGDAPDVILASG